MAHDTPVDIAEMLTEVGIDAQASPATSIGVGMPPRTEETVEGVPALRPRAPELKFGKLLGAGEVSEVFEGEQQALRRQVALRTVHSQHRNEGLEGYIVSDAWMLGALEHPNILPVYDLRRDEHGHPVVAMKRIEAVAWDTVIKAGGSHPLSCSPGKDEIEFAIRRVLSVCRALEHAHGRGVIHRDVKPENVLIDREGNIYLDGWDLAVAVDQDPGGRFPPLSSQTDVAGTPAYMSPELATRDFAKQGPATDVYLTAATLHEVVVGRPRHLGENVFDAFYSAVASVPIDYSDEIPAELGAILNRAMAAEPTERYRSVGEFRGALEAFLANRPSLELVRHGTVAEGEMRRAIEAGRMPSAVRVLFATAFGSYSSALRFWSANRTAIEALDRLQQLMIDYELQHGDAERARDLIQQYAPDDPQLLAQLTAAEQRERRSVASTQTHLTQAEPSFEQIVVVAQPPRGLLIGGVVAGLGVVALSAAFLVLKSIPLALAAAACLGALLPIVYSVVAAPSDSA